MLRQRKQAVVLHRRYWVQYLLHKFNALAWRAHRNTTFRDFSQFLLQTFRARLLDRGCINCFKNHPVRLFHKRTWRRIHRFKMCNEHTDPTYPKNISIHRPKWEQMQPRCTYGHYLFVKTLSCRIFPRSEMLVQVNEYTTAFHSPWPSRVSLVQSNTFWCYMEILKWIQISEVIGLCFPLFRGLVGQAEYNP